MTFTETVIYAAGIPEFVENFNRLSGHNFGKSARRAPIERMVDDACGMSGEADEDMAAFINFVYEFVWMRLPES